MNHTQEPNKGQITEQLLKLVEHNHKTAVEVL